MNTITVPRHVPASWLIFIVGLMLSCVVSANPIGFVTRQDRDDVLAVDLSNGAILRSIPSAIDSPFEIALSRDGSTAFVTTGSGSSPVSVALLSTTNSIPPVTVGGSPVSIEIAVLPNGSKLYTADWTNGTVSVFDTVAKTRLTSIPTAFLSYDVAAHPNGSRVFATALRSSNVFVIDTATDTIADQIPIGRDFLGHIAVTPDGHRAYISEFRDRVSILDLDTKLVVQTIPFDASGANGNNGALDIEIDPRGHFAYVLGFDTVNVIDLGVDQLVATIPVGIELSDIAFDPTGLFAYVTTIGAIPNSQNQILKIDTSTFAITDRYTIEGLLVGLAVAPAVAQVPEPGTLLLLATGSAALFVVRRRWCVERGNPESRST